MTPKFIIMNENRLMQQVTAIFSIFMVFFYLGVGCYFVFFSDLSYLDKSVQGNNGINIYFLWNIQGYRAYVKIVEVFFTKDKDEE